MVSWRNISLTLLDRTNERGLLVDNDFFVDPTSTVARLSVVHFPGQSLCADSGGATGIPSRHKGPHCSCRRSGRNSFGECCSHQTAAKVPNPGCHCDQQDHNGCEAILMSRTGSQLRLLLRANTRLFRGGGTSRQKVSNEPHAPRRFSKPV